MCSWERKGRFCMRFGEVWRLQMVPAEEGTVGLEYKVVVEIMALKAAFPSLNSSCLSVPWFPCPWNGNDESSVMKWVPRVSHGGQGPAQGSSQGWLLLLSSVRMCLCVFPLLVCELLEGPPGCLNHRFVSSNMNMVACMNHGTYASVVCLHSLSPNWHHPHWGYCGSWLGFFFFFPGQKMASFLKRFGSKYRQDVQL